MFWFLRVDSNFTTSGGFGPNQVSAVLGLGAMLLMLVTVLETKHWYRWIALSLALGLLVLSVLTFSRGGLYNFAAAILLASVFFIRRPGTRNSVLFILGVTILVCGYWVYPRLDSFTGGMLQERFSDIGLTNRAEIANTELEIWFDNPVLGVGPGMAKYEGIKYGQVFTAAHTEYTRLLAEHGVLGILAILILLIMSLRAIRKAPGAAAQAWTAALLAWPLTEMTHAAMRVAAIGFIFGLALCGWMPEQQPKVSRLK